jgi:hypothetical protein
MNNNNVELKANNIVNNPLANIVNNPLANVDNNGISTRITDTDMLQEVENVSDEIWSILSSDIKQIIIAEENKISIPEGISEKLWDILADDVKRKILLCIKSNKGVLDNKTWWQKRDSSSVWSFFTNFESNHFEFESAIQAMSLISALILTVPFAVAGTFNSDFFETLYSQMESCDSTTIWGNDPITTYNFYYSNIRLYLGGSLFCSLYSLW